MHRSWTTYPPFLSRYTAALRGTYTTPSGSCMYRSVPCPMASHTGKAARNASRSDTGYLFNRNQRRPGVPGSAVADVADDAHREWCVNRQRFFGVDADLALARDERPVDLVIVLPGFDFGHVRHFVRLVLDRQVFGPANDGAGRHARMDPYRDPKT